MPLEESLGLQELMCIPFSHSNRNWRLDVKLPRKIEILTNPVPAIKLGYLLAQRRFLLDSIGLGEFKFKEAEGILLAEYPIDINSLPAEAMAAFIYGKVRGGAHSTPYSFVLAGQFYVVPEARLKELQADSMPLSLPQSRIAIPSISAAKPMARVAGIENCAA